MSKINIYFKKSAFSIILMKVKIFRKYTYVTANCWFCNLNSKILFEEKNNWYCIHCKQFNGFNKVRNLFVSKFKYWLIFTYTIQSKWSVYFIFIYKFLNYLIFYIKIIYIPSMVIIASQFRNNIVKILILSI